MKKIIIAIILLAIAGLSIFSYKKYIKEPKKVEFSTILGKEFVYTKDGLKTDITLTFSNDGIYGFGGVNRYFAGYKAEDDGRIRFSPIGSTLMAGPQEKMQKEREFFELLSNVNRIETYESKIVLSTLKDQKLIFVESNGKNKIETPETKIEEVDLSKEISEIKNKI